MTGWLEPVLQHRGESRKEEVLLERVGASISPGHTAADLVQASQKWEKKPSLTEKKGEKGFRKYSSVRNCFKEQFSSFSTFHKYCSSIIVAVCSSGRAMK